MLRSGKIIIFVIRPPLLICQADGHESPNSGHNDELGNTSSPLTKTSPKASNLKSSWLCSSNMSWQIDSWLLSPLDQQNNSYSEKVPSLHFSFLLPVMFDNSSCRFFQAGDLFCECRPELDLLFKFLDSSQPFLRFRKASRFNKQLAVRE